MKITQRVEVVFLFLFFYPLIVSCKKDWLNPKDFYGWLNQVFYIWAKNLVFWFFVYLFCLLILHEIGAMMARKKERRVL